MAASFVSGMDADALRITRAAVVAAHGDVEGDHAGVFDHQGGWDLLADYRGGRQTQGDAGVGGDGGFAATIKAVIELNRFGADWGLRAGDESERGDATREGDGAGCHATRQAVGARAASSAARGKLVARGRVG